MSLPALTDLRPRGGRLIDFNRPHMTGKELHYIAAARFHGKLDGEGPFTRLCHEWLERSLSAGKALLTRSCAAALETAALILDISPGDEVIVPSFSPVTTANAFVLRGAAPVFVDIRPDTLNMDETAVEAAFTPRTRAIVPVHYAGVACEMDEIMRIAASHGAAVVEDASRALMAEYKGRPLGAIGDIGALSFHETRNVISGEGGAILLNRAEHVPRAETLRRKGAGRSRFFRGEADRRAWRSEGSSFLPGELTAAFLWAQLEDAEAVCAGRRRLWDRYHELLEPLETAGKIRRPKSPPHCLHNAHIYYILADGALPRRKVMERLTSDGIQAFFHHVPLHSFPAGMRFGRVSGSMEVTCDVAARLLRLPLWIGLTEEDQERVAASLASL
ncbi:MAG: dTDP-4-amino-4,6-dideoxygalactose transaminase [Deltaproteobacteria bacterium]|nr:dTDP-4-amino-4,6-dideoxygalactose transaminase [Deltaproteobacteria bacterium]